MCSFDLSRTEDNYNQSNVGQAEGNIKNLYAVISDLLGRSIYNPLPFYSSAVSLATDFLRYFVDKIVKLRNDLNNVPHSSVVNPTSSCNDSPVISFTEFPPIQSRILRNLCLHPNL